MKTIRAALALIALCALTTIDVRPSAAEIFRPWCAQYVGGDGNNGTNCTFSSYEQCMLTARGPARIVSRILGICSMARVARDLTPRAEESGRDVSRLAAGTAASL